MKEVFKAIEEYERRAKQLARFLVDGRMSIGVALRESRKAKRMSLRSMAKTLKISAAYLSDVELGKRGVSSTLLERLKNL